MQTIYEFLLWNNCLFGDCTFCHQRAHERKIDDKILTPEQQVASLNKCKEFLESNKFIKGNHILLVGGEIFDIVNKDVKKEFIALIKEIKDKLCLNKVDLLYINTNLLYKDISLLDWFLALFEANGLLPRLKFATSYDILGRFTSKERELLFYHNLKYITDTYKDLKVVVNTVLTNEACKRICEDKFGADYLLQYLKEQDRDTFTIKDWIEYFRVDINTIPYIRLDDDKAPQMPTKSTVLETLLHIDTIIPGYLKKYSDNIALKQPKLLYEYNKSKQDFDFCSSKLGECGHSVNFTRCFADSDRCYPCEIQKLLKYKSN